MRWFKHFTDSLDDPFIQELLVEFGANGYLVYFGIIEIIAKENKNNLTGKLTVSPTFLKQKLHISSGKLQEIFRFCSGKGKLIFNFSQENFNFDFPKIAEIKDNYSKDLQGACKKLSNHKEVEVEVEVEKNKHISSELKKPQPSEWPKDDFWLQEFIKQQTFLPYQGLLDHKWWEAVSNIFPNGLNPKDMNIEFSKMQTWLIENRSRQPTQKGVKRFVRTWLERAYEKERRYPNGNKDRPR